MSCRAKQCCETNVWADLLNTVSQRQSSAQEGRKVCTQMLKATLRYCKDFFGSNINILSLQEGKQRHLRRERTLSNQAATFKVATPFRVTSQCRYVSLTCGKPPLFTVAAHTEQL